MTTAQAWRDYEDGNRLARYHYRDENHCAICTAPRPFHLNRRPSRCDDCRKETQ